ncbi:DHA1 family purine ribonucleoside efflux pump-like MFS transporter/DHA1 family bicyclomycin/chloramphenicol resistance-like MFS transporter [Agrobacterium vitis]|nr:DHA1 family purine ribonucleoside efflux pump-like MFS transporter/DHA1 family bicyclomycin/chloramphenicol resistance-like MFS transporter [Agrobacterium vitis]MBE1438994.1 DHA1 family purine ribonucleoside efflux pump-like MFS transporter/DHA1 family bicyclomycin/chloramphenicol resistance-like MFS transporter [Agrobacterium vitis]
MTLSQTHPAQTPPTRMSENRTSMLGALLTMIGPLSMSIYTPAMPQLVHAFSTTDAAIKLSLSLYFAGFACAQLLSGPCSDAFGRRHATLFFLSIYLIGSLLAAFAPSVNLLLAGRIIQGIGASVGVTVSRAIVRDQFAGTEAARILNMIGIMLAIGPAMGPTVGGLALAAFGWQSVFFLMVGFGITSFGVVALLMKETITPDRSLIRPTRLIAAYGTLMADLRVLLAALVLGGCVGALYAQSTMLPFVLINKVGLTPSQFGLGMLMQTGSYFFGSVALRMVAKKLPIGGALIFGLTLAGFGGVLIFLSTHLITPTYLSIMGPVAICSFGMAFVIPDITTAGLTPHPKLAGSASALLGFVQMGCGFLGGVGAAWLGDPLTAFGTIIPAMEFLAIFAYLGFRRAWKRAA